MSSQVVGHHELLGAVPLHAHCWSRAQHLRSLVQAEEPQLLYSVASRDCFHWLRIRTKQHATPKFTCCFLLVPSLVSAQTTPTAEEQEIAAHTTGHPYAFKYAFKYDHHVLKYNQVRAFDTTYEPTSTQHTTCKPPKILISWVTLAYTTGRTILSMRALMRH